MLHGSEGQPGKSHIGMNVAVLLLCIRISCYAECGAYQAFQTKLATSSQELGFDRSHNGGWKDDEFSKAMLLKCDTLGSTFRLKEFLPGIIEKKCRWSLHKCLWHCKATSDCLAFEFGTGNAGGDPFCRYYNSTAVNSTDTTKQIGPRINDPSVIFESFIRCKKGYTQVGTDCGGKIHLQDRHGDHMTFPGTFEECRAHFVLTPAECAKENKDGFNYGCKSFDFSKGFKPQDGPDHCQTSEPRFEDLPCSFKTKLGEGDTCTNFCNNQIAGTKCVRSWLQENVADFGQNNCDKTYLQLEHAVCVCANVGNCTLYADAPTRPACNDKVPANETSTHFRMDKPTVIPENLPQDITVRNLSDPITDLALARFADYSTQKLTCDDGGSVNLYNGGKLNLYDCTQACKQTPGCFVFKYEEREIDGVLYPTVCKWQKTLKWNECVHTRRLSEYSQRQDIQNAIFSGLYQVAEDGNYNPAGCLLPGQYRTQSGECKSQKCKLTTQELTSSKMQILSDGDSSSCTDNGITLKANQKCSLECKSGSFNQNPIQTLNCRPGPSNQEKGHLNTALISCREQTCVVDGAALKNMHTTAADESCVEVSSYERGYLVKKITLKAAGDESERECKMKCDTGYYYPHSAQDPTLKCTSNTKTSSSGSLNDGGNLKCEPKFCILTQEDYKQYNGIVDFSDCIGTDRFKALRNQHKTEMSNDATDIVLEAVGDLTSCALGCLRKEQIKNESTDTRLRCSPLSNSRDRGTTNEDGIIFVCVNKTDETAIPDPQTFLNIDMSIMMILILLVVSVLVLVIVPLIACCMDRISYRRVKKHVKKH